ncbi:MAG TPA: aspartate 1-decarboxylase [Gemmatimonadota bacterium]|nr:aspartate 1-decarboxylase [Gemmatimonadota bacterium]
MLRTMLRAKIHRARITDANLEYEGSLTVDDQLLKAAGILPFEQVMVSNLNNGERFETYVIPGARNSGVVCLNGAAARRVHRGDLVIIASFCGLDEEAARRHEPVIVRVDERNRVRESEGARVEAA